MGTGIRELSSARAAADRYFSQYLIYSRMLYAETHGYGGYDSCCGDAALTGKPDQEFRNSAGEIRCRILETPDPKERAFLFQYYVRGQTVERCAEILDLSPRTAFRLKNRALMGAAKRLGLDGAQEEQEQEQTREKRKAD